MKEEACLVVVLSVVFACSPLAVAQVPRDKDPLRELARTAQEQPIGGIMKQVTVHTWSSPLIRSSMYTSRLLDARQKEIEDLKRQIGASIAKRTTESAERLIAGTNTAVLQGESADLLALANWIGKEPGYENILLVARCHDVAAIGLAKLAVDEAVPLEKVRSLLNTCNTDVYSAQQRCQVLNNEFGVSFIDVKGLSEADAQQCLESTWGTGQALRRRQKMGEDITTLVDVPSGIDLAKIKEYISMFEESASAREAAAKPLSETWEVFQPERLVAGLLPKNIELVQALVEFRENVGAFPVVAGNPKEGKAAFEAAWRKHWDINSSRRHRTLYSTAWHAYSKVQAGTFIDADTLCSRVVSTSER